MEEKSDLFSRPQSKTALNQFKGRINAINTADSFEMARNSHIKTIIHAMEINPQQWDDLCQININWVGDQFISRLSDKGEELDKDKAR